MIDDGSSEQRWKSHASRFQTKRLPGELLILTKPNGGKAEALNFGLEYLTDEEIFVGIDADTVIAKGAIALLVPHFLDPKVGAIAGNAKVGNRVNCGRAGRRWSTSPVRTSSVAH